MRIEDAAPMLESLEVPVAYMLFPEKEAPALPFICYYEGTSNNFYADGKVYFAVTKLFVEVYTKIKDLELEKEVEELFSEIKWSKDTEWIESEQCFLTTYEMEINGNV